MAGTVLAIYPYYIYLGDVRVSADGLHFSDGFVIPRIVKFDASARLKTLLALASVWVSAFCQCRRHGWRCR